MIGTSSRNAKILFALATVVGGAFVLCNRHQASKVGLLPGRFLRNQKGLTDEWKENNRGEANGEEIIFRDTRVDFSDRLQHAADAAGDYLPEYTRDKKTIGKGFKYLKEIDGGVLFNDWGKSEFNRNATIDEMLDVLAGEGEAPHSEAEAYYRALGYTANGGRWLWEAPKKQSYRHGVRKEIIASRHPSKAEKDAYKGICSPKGITPEEFSESMPDTYVDQNTMRAEAINALLAANTKTAAKQLIENAYYEIYAKNDDEAARRYRENQNQDDPFILTSQEEDLPF